MILNFLNKKSFRLFLFVIFYLLIFTFAFAQPSQFELPSGEPVTYASISAGLDLTAKFLYGAGVTLAVITLAISGIMFFWAKSDTEAKNAKGWFRNGIIGTFVILAIGVIIKTVEVFIKGEFFGGPPATP